MTHIRQGGEIQKRKKGNKCGKGQKKNGNKQRPPKCEQSAYFKFAAKSQPLSLASGRYSKASGEAGKFHNKNNEGRIQVPSD